MTKMRKLLLFLEMGILILILLIPVLYSNDGDTTTSYELNSNGEFFGERVYASMVYLSDHTPMKCFGYRDNNDVLYIITESQVPNTNSLELVIIKPKSQERMVIEDISLNGIRDTNIDIFGNFHVYYKTESNLEFKDFTLFQNGTMQTQAIEINPSAEKYISDGLSPNFMTHPNQTEEYLMVFRNLHELAVYTKLNNITTLEFQDFRVSDVDIVIKDNFAYLQAGLVNETGPNVIIELKLNLTSNQVISNSSWEIDQNSFTHSEEEFSDENEFGLSGVLEVPKLLVHPNGTIISVVNYYDWISYGEENAIRNIGIRNLEANSSEIIQTNFEDIHSKDVHFREDGKLVFNGKESYVFGKVVQNQFVVDALDLETNTWTSEIETKNKFLSVYNHESTQVYGTSEEFIFKSEDIPDGLANMYGISPKDRDTGLYTEYSGIVIISPDIRFEEPFLYHLRKNQELYFGLYLTGAIFIALALFNGVRLVRKIKGERDIREN